MGKWNAIVPEVIILEKKCLKESDYTIHRVIVFMLTFASYIQIYALRKTMSYVKSTVVDIWVPLDDQILVVQANDEATPIYKLFSRKQDAENFLGALDSIFMFSYAVALYFLGALSDRFEPRLVLVFGMISSAILTAIFGFATEICHFYSVPFYVCIWILNGICQSASWPTVVKLMDNWFGKSKRGFIFGVWSSAASVGSIVGAYVCSGMMPFGYEYAFLVNASLLLVIAIFILFGVVSAPKDLDGPIVHLKEESVVENGNSKMPNIIQTKKPQAIGFLKAILLPGVIAYALSYTCLKSVNYSIFFWLPYYMRANFGWDPSTSATLSTFFDWGGILGSTICGLASDLLGKRSPILVSMLIFAIVSLGGYSASPNNQIVNGLLMGIVGFFVNGATNLVSSAVTADLGRQSAVRNDKEALSTVSGIIEGSGSGGAAIGQAILPIIADTFGWNSIFYMFMIMLFISASLLARLCYRESKEAIHEFRTRILSVTGGIGEREIEHMHSIHVVENGNMNGYLDMKL